MIKIFTNKHAIFLRDLSRSFKMFKFLKRLDVCVFLFKKCIIRRDFFCKTKSLLIMLAFWAQTVKGEMYEGKQDPLEMNLTCFGRIHLYFAPICSFFKPQKCIFSQLILRNRAYEVKFSANIWRLWQIKCVTWCRDEKLQVEERNTVLI